MKGDLMSITTQKLLLGLGWAIAAITIWSGSLVMLRLGVTTSLGAYDLTALRFGVAALILAPFTLRYGLGTERLGMVGLVAMVIAFGAPYVLLIAFAMTTAPASAAGALNPGVMALVSVLLGWVILGDAIGRVRFIGLVATVAGIVLFTKAGGVFTTGHLILIGTGIMWASYSLIVRCAAVPALNATAIVAVGSAIVYLPVYFVALPKQIFAAPLTDILLQTLFQGLLVSVVAVYAFNRSVELLGSVTGAALPALIPVVTLGFGHAVLGEEVGIHAVFSAALVTIGLGLILIGKPAMGWFSHHIARVLKRIGRSQEC